MKRLGGKEKKGNEISTNPVLRISGCTLYSLANTKGTIPCGRAACLFVWQSKHNTFNQQNMLVVVAYICLLFIIKSIISLNSEWISLLDRYVTICIYILLFNFFCTLQEFYIIIKFTWSNSFAEIQALHLNYRIN